MNIQIWFTRSWQLLLLAAILLTMAACVTIETVAAPTPTEMVAAPAGTNGPPASDLQPASATPTAPTLSPTPAASPTSPEAPAAELQATVAANLPPTPTADASGYSGPGIEGVEVISLTNTTGDRPLWAAFSYGMRSFDPQQNHFVAIYSHNEAGWEELGCQALEDVDYLDQASVEQVELEPDHVWLRKQFQQEENTIYRAEGPSSTQMTFEHRHLDRHGEGGVEYRAGLTSPQGWSYILDRYVKAVT